MNDFLNDAEQGEYVKRWIKKNVPGLALILLLTIAANIGWQKYQMHQFQKAQEASIIYIALPSTTPLPNQAIEMANSLKKNYESTPYAGLAALLLAKNDVAQNNLEQASTELNWTMEHASNDTLKQVARMNLARIDIQQKNNTGAIALLEKIDSPALAGMAESIKGDAYFADNQMAQARKSYEQAQTLLPAQNPEQQRLSMKLNDLPQQ